MGWGQALILIDILQDGPRGCPLGCPSIASGRACLRATCQRHRSRLGTQLFFFLQQSMAARSRARDGIKPFTYLEGLRGMVDCLRRVSRHSPGTPREVHYDSIIRVHAELKLLERKKKDDIFDTQDLARCQRLLSDCTCACAGIAAGVRRLASTTHNYVKCTCRHRRG